LPHRWRRVSAAFDTQRLREHRLMTALALSSLWLLADAEGSAAFGLPFLRLYVFVLAGFVGYQIITKVPALLHTPLMSATNAISGISLVGSLVAAGAMFSGYSTVLGFIAVTAATINVVGGFMITDRMLKMFKRQERK
jgi:NAD(P) transhydrogenase subunit alpha